jgi:hypothetical protein
MGWDEMHSIGSQAVDATRLSDPYTGRPMHFIKVNPLAVQIEDVVPLALVWDLGADRWSRLRRNAYANDTHLVSSPSMSPPTSLKGTRPGDWMPPNGNVACNVARFIAVLTATSSHHECRQDKPPQMLGDRDGQHRASTDVHPS